MTVMMDISKAPLLQPKQPREHWWVGFMFFFTRKSLYCTILHSLGQLTSTDLVTGSAVATALC